MTKNAYFGPNLAVFGQKILTFMGGGKSFGTNVTKKPPRHLVGNVYWSAWDHLGQKCQYLAEQKQCCAKFGRLGAKNPNFYGSN